MDSEKLGRVEEIWINRLEERKCRWRVIPEKQITEAMALAMLRHPTMYGSCSLSPLKTLPEHAKTERVIATAGLRCPGWLSEISEQAWTPSLVALLCGNKHKWGWLSHCPQTLITKEMAWDAVVDNGINLEHVPTDLKTEALCIEAIKNNGSGYRWLPDSMRTAENLKAAVQSNGFGALISLVELGELPVGVEDQINLAKSVMKADRYSAHTLERLIESMPEAFDDDELLELAIQANPVTILALPDDMLTVRLAEMALLHPKADPKAHRNETSTLYENPLLSLVCRKMKIPDELVLRAIQAHPENLGLVDREIRTPEMVLTACRANPQLWELIPTHEAANSEELVVEWAKQDAQRLYEITDPALYDKAKQALANAGL